MAQTDTTARIAALQDFLKNYASSPFRPAVYSRLCDLLERKSPDQSAAFLSEHLQSERDPASRGRIYYAQYTHAKDHAPGEVGTVIQALENDASPDANVYNMVAWDLVEQGTRLDDAVKLASIGADKAPDSLSKAEVLDTKGWAQFTKGDYREAAGTLELAVGLGPKEEDIRGHLAEACDKAGDAARARDLYAGLLVAHEDPQMRSRLEALVRQTGGSAKNVFQKIDADRKAQARPAADFALQDYDGKEIQFAGATRGRSCCSTSGIRPEDLAVRSFRTCKTCRSSMRSRASPSSRSRPPIAPSSRASSPIRSERASPSSRIPRRSAAPFSTCAPHPPPS